MGRIATFAQPRSFAGLRLDRWGAPLIVTLLLAVLLVISNAIALQLVARSPYTVDAGGYGDQLVLKGFFAQEENDRGETYRWTGPASAIEIRGAALSPRLKLDISVGGVPANAPQPLPVGLTVNGASWGQIAVAPTPRRYHLLFPATSDANLTVAFASPLTSSPDDPRPVGMRVDDVQVRLVDAGLLLPLPTHLLAQFACLGLLALTLVRLRIRKLWLLVIPAFAAPLLGLLQAAALPVMGMYLPRLVGACAALTLLTWTGFPLARRWMRELSFSDMRWLWAFVLLACAVRMFGMLYPPFATHDVSLNLRRLDAVSRGILVLVAPSAEFAGQLTIYPPAPYVALLPTYLLTNSRPLVLFAGLSLLDGTTTLMIGWLALRLGLGSLTARLAAAAYAGSSLSFTALWWGFTAQVFGQWFSVPLALALLVAFKDNRRSAWLAAAICFQIAILSHAGVAVLAVVWVTFALALCAIRERMRPPWWRAALVFYVLSGLIAIALLYADVLLLMIQQTQIAHESASEELGQGVNDLFWKGLRLAYSPPGLVLALIGFGLLCWRLRRPGAWSIIVAWGMTLLFFVVVDLLYGLIVRHFYFALPLACIAAAYALSFIARRNRWLNALVWSLIALFCANGLFLWWYAVVEYSKPTMTPLTH